VTDSDPVTDTEQSTEAELPTRGEGADEARTQPFDAVAAVAELEAAMAEADAQSPDSAADGAARYVETLENEVLELNELLAAKDAELAKADARAESARDEVEQAKARLSKEAERAAARKVREVPVSMIEVLDDLDRALAGVTEANQPDLVAGVEQVQRQFLAKLAAQGVRPQQALGLPFDPTQHHAVTTAPASEPDQRGTIVSVMRPGYAIGDELLRPAMVVVGK
jgi:molecular chaperone GrpE